MGAIADQIAAYEQAEKEREKKEKEEFNKLSHTEKYAQSRNYADASDLKNINVKNKEAAKKVESVNVRTEKDYKIMMQRQQDAANEAKKAGTSGKKDVEAQKKDLEKEADRLRKEKIKHSEGISKWYEGIATSYEDIAKRYQDAVVGLSEAEAQTMKGTAQQDFGAMSAMGAQAFSTIRGGSQPMTGNQQASLAAVAQRSATDAYSASMDRMAAIDEQRRQMQFNIVGAASDDERANRELGYNIQSGIVQQDAAMEDATVGRVMQARQQSMGYDSFIYDTQTQNNMYQTGMLGAINDLRQDTIDTNVFAQTSPHESAIAYRSARAGEQLAWAGLDAQTAQSNAARRTSQGQMIGSVIGGVAGWIGTGNPAGGAAGATIGGAVGGAAAG